MTPQTSSVPGRGVAAGAAVQPEIDVDTWWHLRVGEYVAETRSVPTTDPFSQVGQSENRPWVAYSWLYELGLYAMFKIGGPVGLSYARFLLSALTLATFAWYLVTHSKVVMIVFVLLVIAAGGAVASTTVITARMEALRAGGQSGSPEFMRLHGYSMLAYLIEAAVLLASVITTYVAIAYRGAAHHKRPATEGD